MIFKTQTDSIINRQSYTQAENIMMTTDGSNVQHLNSVYPNNW